MTRNYLKIFGCNLDAVLDTGNPTKNLAAMVKGQRHPEEFFTYFGGRW